MSFLMTRGLTSAMYLLLLRLLHRDYAAAFRLAESVASDSAFDTAARHIFSDLQIANRDMHPDCHACRVKLALVTIDSGEGTPWDLTDNQSRLTVKAEHVSVECRVSREEELQLLSSDRMVTAPDNRWYNPKIHTQYRMIIVKNRLAALATIASRQSPSARPGSGVVMGRARCWMPQREPHSNWPTYQDNTVFGESHNEVVNVGSSEELSELLAESEDPSGDLGGPMLTVLCFYVDWSEVSLKQEAAIRDAAPSVPFVRFLAVRADHAMKDVVRRVYGVTDFPTWLLMRGQTEVGGGIGSGGDASNSTSRVVVASDDGGEGNEPGPNVGFERLKELIDHHVTESDRAAYATRKMIAEESRRARGADDEALEELEWIWDSEMAGMSMNFGAKCMEAVLPRIDIGESKEVRWEYCNDGQSMIQNTAQSADQAVVAGRALTWTPYSESLNTTLEQVRMALSPLVRPLEFCLSQCACLSLPCSCGPEDSAMLAQCSFRMKDGASRSQPTRTQDSRCSLSSITWFAVWSSTTTALEQ